MKGEVGVKFKSILLAGALAAAGTMAHAQNLDIVCEKQQTFKVGEEIPFTVTAWKGKDEMYKAGTVVFSFKDSGGKKLREDLALDLAKGNPANFTVKLDHPGFILISASPCSSPDGKKVKWKTKPVAPLGGAAVEPEKIVPGTECPKDFDSFWQAGLKEFQNAAVEVTPAPDIKRKNYKVSRITVKFPDGSGLVSGYLSIPEKPGKYPALAGVPGAGCVNTYMFTPVPHWPSPVPAIELWMNVHNFPVPADRKQQKEAYKKYIQSLGCGYWLSKAEKRETYFFRNVWLAVSRAVDYVAGLPEYDGKHFAAAGNSQGGGTALVLGGMNKNITCVAASVPALCDHGGWKLGRQAGWPQLHIAKKGKADAAAPYFDAAYFAARIKVPTLVSVGFIDVTCSPASVYAAFNSIPAGVPKQIFHMYRDGHSTGSPRFRPVVNKFLKEQLTK